MVPCSGGIFSTPFSSDGVEPKVCQEDDVFACGLRESDEQKLAFSSGRGSSCFLWGARGRLEEEEDDERRV